MDWNLPENDVTPEDVFHERRALLRAMGLGAIGVGLGGPGALSVFADGEGSAKIPGYPAKRNPAWAAAGRDLTKERIAGRYNNFYEFTTDKFKVAPLANAYKWRPWTVTIGGLVKKPLTLDIDDLTKKLTLEERIYRFRCVEAWAMTVPWTGFTLASLLELVEPKPEAKYVRFITKLDKKRMPGQRRLGGYSWPYYEALSMDEARNDLTLMATGIYGKPLPGAHGAPIRLVVPWKYGFKSAKSIVRIEFVAKRPTTFWMDASDEYGFWANINPEVPHARWSQAKERLLGVEGDKVPTQLYNGYGKWVAEMYKELVKTEKTFY